MKHSPITIVFLLGLGLLTALALKENCVRSRNPCIPNSANNRELNPEKTSYVFGYSGSSEADARDLE